MHSCSVEDSFAVADEPVAAATVVYTVAEGLVVGVTLVGFEQPVHFGVVLDAMLLVVVDSTYYLVQLALDNPWVGGSWYHT